MTPLPPLEDSCEICGKWLQVEASVGNPQALSLSTRCTANYEVFPGVFQPVEICFDCLLNSPKISLNPEDFTQETA